MNSVPSNGFATPETTGHSLHRTRLVKTEEQVYEQTPNMLTLSDAPQAGRGWDFGAQQRICLGSIIDVKAQLLSTGGIHNTWNEGAAKCFAVVQEGDYFALECLGVKFGRLKKGLCKGLYELTARKQIWMLGYASDNDWTAAIGSWNVYITALLPMEINVYGAREDAKEIGGILSKSSIFLQRPSHGLHDSEYYNPHLLRIEGYSEQVPAEIPRLAEEISIETPDRNVDEAMRVNDSEMVDSILDSLSHHIHLQETSVAPDVKSTLLTHQREAIDFILRRETAQAPPERSLWKYNNVDADQPFYQHVFTGAKRPEPAEAKGGIIADEMGLGKSLVMLYTVISSLNRAHAFFAAENQLLSSQPSRRVPSKATLILAPSSLLIDNWIDEIRKHTYPGALPFHKHLGPSRHTETGLLRERVIVFTTYATVAAESRRGNSTLSKINWFRIILDEAHDIRNRSTKQFGAVAGISAQHRWCLTGTPVQNSLDDLGALIAFLRVPVLEKPATFRKFITHPISSASKHRFQNLQMLLQSICLRRTRELLDLPKPIPKTRRLHLTPSERAEYDDLLQQCKVEIDMTVSRRGKTKMNSAVLESLLKLRLFCNNGRANAVLRPGPTGLPADHDEALAYLQQLDENICAYCAGTIYSISDTTGTDGGMFISSSCIHLVCHNCTHHKRTQKKACPTCATGNELTSLTILSPAILSEGYIENGSAPQPHQYPSKLLKLLSDIQEDFNHKSIVFSCWKRTLGLVSELLRGRGLRHYMIDGSLPLSERVRVLKDFRLPTGANILLMTLGTGAVGLNLAVASRVYLMEPQWNPSIESQAIGRALRLGQTDQVVIVRYITAHTVEESNVLSRQRRKLELAGGGFSKGKDMPRERLQALLDVFGVAM